MRYTLFCAAIALGTASLVPLSAQAEPVGSGSRPLTGTASWYQMGKVTANGERYNPDGLTAAHRSLPFGTTIRVTNKRNGKSVSVRVNDRGPFVGNRVIDLSRGAARQIGMINSGVAQVDLEIGK